MKGFTYGIDDMSAGERDWHLKRVDKQLKDEAKAIKNAGRKRR